MSITESITDQDEPGRSLAESEAAESETAEVEVLVEEISIDGMCGVY